MSRWFCKIIFLIAFKFFYHSACPTSFFLCLTIGPTSYYVSRLFCKLFYLIAFKFLILRLVPLLFFVIFFFALPSARFLITSADGSVFSKKIEIQPEAWFCKFPFLIALKFLILRLISHLFFTIGPASYYASYYASPIVKQIFLSHRLEVSDPSACPTSFLCDLFLCFTREDKSSLWFNPEWGFTIGPASYYASPMVYQISFSHCLEVSYPSACPTSFLNALKFLILRLVPLLFFVIFFFALPSASYYFSRWSSKLFYLITLKFENLRLVSLLCHLFLCLAIGLTSYYISRWIRIFNENRDPAGGFV